MGATLRFQYIVCEGYGLKKDCEEGNTALFQYIVCEGYGKINRAFVL